MKILARIFIFLLFSLSLLQADTVITEAQSRLKRQGFYDGTVDGQMGSQTSAAIRRYQLAQNLKVTGELNPQTLGSLGLTAPPQARPQKPQKVQQPVPEYVALADIFKGGPYISIGAEYQIEAIRQAQKNLKILGYYSGPVDGSPSPRLVAGLRAWQQNAGFRQTGRFDENTLKGLDLMPN